MTAFGSKDFSAGAAFVDGAYAPIGAARISVLDWGFLKSDSTVVSGRSPAGA